MAMTATSAKEIAAMGVDVIINADSNYTSASVKEIIRVAVKAGSKVQIHTGQYTTTSLKEMIKVGNGNVSIVI